MSSLCAAQHTTTQGATPATPSATSIPPRMYFEDASRLGRPFAKDPSVVQFQDAYYMYYSLPAGDPHYITDTHKLVWGIGIARSHDLYHWVKVGEIPLEQEAELQGIAAPGARVIKGRVELFYQSYDSANPRNNSICHATSSDGVHFRKDPTNPVYRPEHMPWSAGRAIDAEVFVQGDKLRMYFATRDPAMKVQMLALAEAPLTSGFARGTWKDVSTDGPLLKPELPWEGLCIEAPTIIEHNGELILFYAGNYNNQPQQIGAARSKDGIHWTRISDTPLLANGVKGTWNSSESGHPGALQLGDRYFLFYQGNADNGKSYYLSVVPITWQGNMPQLNPEPNNP